MHHRRDRHRHHRRGDLTNRSRHRIRETTAVRKRGHRLPTPRHLVPAAADHRAAAASDHRAAAALAAAAGGPRLGADADVPQVREGLRAAVKMALPFVTAST